MEFFFSSRRKQILFPSTLESWRSGQGSAGEPPEKGGMSRSAMQVFEPAFVCCGRDMEDAFYALSADGNGDLLTAQSAYEFYRRYMPKLSKEEILRGYNKFVQDFCSGNPEQGVDRQTFCSALEQFSYRIQAKGKGDEVLNELGRMCVEFANNDPVVFQRMLNLPSTLKLSEVQELMVYLMS